MPELEDKLIGYLTSYKTKNVDELKEILSKDYFNNTDEFFIKTQQKSKTIQITAFCH